MVRPRILDAQVPWIAVIRCPTPASIDVRVTDLIGFYSCTCAAELILPQLQNASIHSTVEQILEVMTNGFYDQTGVSADKHAFRIRPHDQRFVSFEWLVHGDVKLSFQCLAHPDPATCLRDELVLPLMRVAEQLRQLVPAELHNQKVLPQLSQLVPLPDFRAPMFSWLFDRALTHKLADKSLNVVSDANGSSPEAGQSRDRAATHDSATSTTTANAGPTASSMPPPSTATSAQAPCSEEEARRLEVREAAQRRRDEKASKAKKQKP